MITRYFILAFVLNLLAFVTVAAQNTSFPKHFEVRYHLNRQGLDIAEIHWKLQVQKDQDFRYTSKSKTIGIAKLFRDEQIIETSDWRFNQGNLQTLRYQYSRSGGKRKRQAEARFDWPQKRLHNTLNGKQWSVALSDRTYDKLNYLLALMQDLKQGQRMDQYQVADGSKFKTYEMHYLKEEPLESALGTIETLVLERHVKGSERVTRVWAAKSLHYLPIKIEHREKGEIVTLNLTQLIAMDGYRLSSKHTSGVN